MKRVKTGINGFDNLIQGGFPDGSVILISGAPGTGKTIFGLEFLYNGAESFNENGLYVTFEQKSDDVIKQGSQFGWKTAPLIKSGKLKILSIPVKVLNDQTIEVIKGFVKENKIKRLVIDSLSTLATNAPIYSTMSNVSIKDVMSDNVVFSPPIIGDFVLKRFIYTFIDDLKCLDCTTLLISEGSSDGKSLSRDTISEFMADGVVLITYESLGGDYSRALIVRKMRHTKNNEDVHPLEISKKGLVVHKIE